MSHCGSGPSASAAGAEWTACREMPARYPCQVFAKPLEGDHNRVMSSAASETSASYVTEVDYPASFALNQAPVHLNYIDRSTVPLDRVWTAASATASSAAVPARRSTCWPTLIATPSSSVSTSTRPMSSGPGPRPGRPTSATRLSWRPTSPSSTSTACRTSTSSPCSGSMPGCRRRSARRFFASSRPS